MWSMATVAAEITRTAADGLVGMKEHTPPLKPRSPFKMSRRRASRIVESICRADWASATDFDATQVDPASITFTPNRATISHPDGQVLDIDKDGDSDLLVHFRVSQINITCEDTRPILRAETFSGQKIVGADFLNIVDCQ